MNKYELELVEIDGRGRKQVVVRLRRIVWSSNDVGKSATLDWRGPVNVMAREYLLAM